MTDLAELRKLLTVATPVPWHVHDTWLDVGGYTAVVWRGEREAKPRRLVWLPTFTAEPWDTATNSWADAELIAGAVNALPDLLERLEALEEIRQRVASGWKPRRSSDWAGWRHEGGRVEEMRPELAAVLWPTTESDA